MSIFCRDGFSGQGLGQKIQLGGLAALTKINDVPTRLPNSLLRSKSGFWRFFCLLFFSTKAHEISETKTIDFIASFEGNGLMPLPVFMGKTNVNLFEGMTMLVCQSSFCIGAILEPVAKKNWERYIPRASRGKVARDGFWVSVKVKSKRVWTLGLRDEPRPSTGKRSDGVGSLRDWDQIGMQCAGWASQNQVTLGIWGPSWWIKETGYHRADDSGYLLLGIFLLGTSLEHWQDAFMQPTQYCPLTFAGLTSI